MSATEAGTGSQVVDRNRAKLPFAPGGFEWKERKRLCVATLLVALLPACVVPVNVGAFVGEGVVIAPGTGGGAGEECGQAGGGLGVGGGAGRVRAYRVTLKATPVDCPNCWTDAGFPEDAGTLPEQTFEVLVATKGAQATLGVVGLADQPLGQVALVRVGEGVAGSGTVFTWKEITRARGPTLDDATEVRTVWAIFEFDRLDTVQTAGTLTLSSRWNCEWGPPPRSAPCGPSPPDAANLCLVVRTFTADLIEPDRWLTATDPIDGARALLVSLDLGAKSRLDTRCGLSRQPPALSTVTPNLRALEVWQATPDLVRVKSRSHQLADAPRIEVAPDFVWPSGKQTRTVETAPSSDVKETRTTSAALAAGACGRFPNFPDTALSLSSSFDCSGLGCAVDDVGAPVRAFCQLDLPWFAIELGPVVAAP